MHIQTKLLENRNKMLRDRGLNDTIFNALLTLDACENQSIQPSELSSALGSSRTNATRVKLPLADINAENAAMRAGQSSEDDINRHVDGWIKSHQALFDQWITAALQ